MRATFIVILLIPLMHSTFAQRKDVVDSLEQLLKNSSEENKVDVLFQLGWELKGSDPALAKSYLSDALDLAKDADYKKGEADAYNGFGAIAYMEGDYFNAQNFFSQALELKIKLNDQQGAASIYNNIAIIRGRQGDLSGSLEYYLKATKLREDTENFHQLSANYSNIGVVYNRMGHYDLSEKYFNKALDISKKLNQSAQISRAYNGLGNVAKMKNDLDDAIKYHNASLEIKKETNNKKGTAVSYNNLGEIYLLKNSVTVALDYFLKAKEINEELNSKASLMISLDGEAICRLYLNQMDNAENAALEALRIAEEVNEPERIQNAHITLALIYASQKDFKKSNQFKNKFYEAKKKYFSEEMQNKIAEMQTRYETEKKEQENELLRQQKAAQDIKLSYQQIIITISILGILIMSYLIFLSIKKSQKLKESNTQLNHQKEAIESKNSQLQALMDENNLLMNIVAHDLKSPINNIEGLVQLMELDNEKGDIKPYLKQIKGMTSSAAYLINDLTIMNQPDLEDEARSVQELDITSMLEQVINDFHKQANDKNISVEFLASVSKMIKGNKDMVRRVLDNLVSNALKFSNFDTVIKIELTNTDSSGLMISVVDEGPGISSDEQKLLFRKFTKLSNRPTNGESSTGLGLAIVKRLVDGMGYSIGVNSKVGDGTTFTITIPKEMVVS